ncbi:hypothetical protein ABFP18_002890 [Enterobacter hormaechei]
MSKKSDFSFFVDMFFSGSYELQDGVVSYDTTDLPIPVSGLVDMLKENGLKSQIHTDVNVIAFSVSSGSLSSTSTIFPRLDDFWRIVTSGNKIPEDFLIINEKIASTKESDVIEKIKLYLKWRAVILSLSVHDIPKKAIWYLPDENGGKEIVITIPESLSRVKEYEVDLKSLESAVKLENVLLLDDAQSSERVSILKKAISDFIGVGSSFENIIFAGERVLNRYNDLLDLYTKRFSVDKILNEIESKNLEYTTKINDYISTSQSKAFTIPGALIAVGALVKVGGFLEGLLILIGLYMIFFIAKTANDAQRESYENLERGLTESFERYHQFDEGTEVRNAAKNTLRALHDKISKATERLDDIDGLGRWMVWLALIYMLLQWLFS